MVQNKHHSDNVGFLLFLFYPFAGPLETALEDCLTLVCVNSFTKLVEGGIE